MIKQYSKLSYNDFLIYFFYIFVLCFFTVTASALFFHFIARLYWKEGISAFFTYICKIRFLYHFNSEKKNLLLLSLLPYMVDGGSIAVQEVGLLACHALLVASFHCWWEVKMFNPLDSHKKCFFLYFQP